MGESIKHQVFPLWNPYQHLGYPIYADMRSVFYPESFVVGLLGGYNLMALHFLFMLHITLGGFGMYKLSAAFTTNGWVRITAATSYVLCGFFVGHGQEMFGIIAATWIPWIVHYFLRFQQSLSWADLWKLALFLFLQLTGGYQALSLMLFYLLLFLFLANIVSRFRVEGGIDLRRRLKMHSALAIVVVCSLTVLLLTYFQVAPNAERLSGVSLHHANLNSINWRALTSFITPFGVTASGEELNIDVSMANLYVGLLWLPLYFLGIFRRKTAFLKVIFWFGLVAFLASMGPLTPVRALLYHFVPGMDMFRMSSFFSYFTQLSIILIGANELTHLFDASERNIKQFNRALAALILLIIGVGFYHYTLWPTAGLEALRAIPELFSLEHDFSFSQRIVIHSGIQLIMLSLLLLGVAFFARKKTRATFTLLFIILEMTLAAHLNFSTTVGGGFNPNVLQAQFDAQPKGFPIPSLNKPVRFHTEKKKALAPLWHNTNIYTKTISSDGFNSFRIDRFEDYRIGNPSAFEENLNQPFLFLLPQRNADGITITDFQPNRVVCQVSLKEASTLVLQQISYPGWHISVDDEPFEVALFEDVFPSAALTAGTHTVVFTYENRTVLIAFGISYAMLLLIVSAIVYCSARERTKKEGLAIGITVAFATALLGSIGYAYSRTDSVVEARLVGYADVLNVLEEHIANSANTSLYLQVDDPIRMQALLQERGWNNTVKSVGNLWGSNYMELRDWLKTDSAERIIVLRSNQPEDELMNELIQEEYPSKETIAVEHDGIYIFDASNERDVLFTSLNNFDSENKDWGFHLGRVDSSARAFSGRFGWAIGEKELGSPAFEMQIGKLTHQRRLRFVYSLKSLIPEGEPNGAQIYIQIMRGGEALWQTAKPIAIYAPNNTDWFDVTVLAVPDFELREDDVLRAFVWSSPSELFYLDDTRVTVYPEK